MNTSDNQHRCPQCGTTLGVGPMEFCHRCLAINLLAPDPVPPSGSESSLRSLGDYDLLEEIGRGSMGIVFRAWHKKLQRDVAVKIVHPSNPSDNQTIHRLKTEATMVARLDHPNIVPVFEAGDIDGEFFLVMGLVRGPNLADITRNGPIMPRAAAELTVRVARAIQHAHERGVLHRDLKPANILLDAQHQPHVTDFGLARRFDLDSSLTQTGQLLGTPAYMAPEQAASLARVGPPADIYSIGALLFHLLTGRPPFVGGSVAELLRHVAEQDPISPRTLNPSVPVDLACVCLRCLEKDPSSRYRDAEELARDLDCCLVGKPTLARPANRLERTWRWCRREPAVAGLTLTALFLVTAIMTISILAALRQSRAREAIAAAESRAKERLTESLLSIARFERASQALGSKFRALDAVREAMSNGPSSHQLGQLRNEAASALLLDDFRQVHRQTLKTPTDGWLLLRPGLRCAMDGRGEIQLQLSDGRTLGLQGNPVRSLPLISPDQRWFAVAEDSSNIPAASPPNSPSALVSLSIEGEAPFRVFAEHGMNRQTDGAKTTIVALWNLGDGRLAGRFQGRFAQFSADSRWAFFFDDTRQDAVVLDLQSGKQTRVEGPVYQCTTSPDGKWAALAQTNGLSLWRLPEVVRERVIARIPSGGPGGHLQFSPDSTALAATTSDDDITTHVRLLDMGSFEVTTPTVPRENLREPWAPPPGDSARVPIEHVVSLNWLDNHTLLLNAMDGCLTYDIETHRALWPFQVSPTNNPAAIFNFAATALDPSHTRVAILKPTELTLADWRTKSVRNLWQSHLGTEIRWEGDHLVLAYQAANQAPQQETWLHHDATQALQYHAHPEQTFREALRNIPKVGDAWLSQDKDGTLYRQGVDEPEAITVGTLGQRYQPIHWARNGRIGIQRLAKSNRLVLLESTEEGEDSIMTKALEGAEGIASSGWPCISGDGRFAATVCAVSISSNSTNKSIQIWVWNVGSRSVVARILPTDAAHLDLQLSEDGSWLLVEHDALEIWSVAESVLVKRLPKPISRGQSSKLSRDKRWLAMEGSGKLTLLDTQSWSLAGEWNTSPFTEYSWPFDISPDARWLAFQMSSRALGLVDLHSKLQVFDLALPAHLEMGGVDFSSDSHRIHLTSKTPVSVDLRVLFHELKALGFEMPGE